MLESPLRQMTEETGGLYFHAPESTDLQEVYTKISSILINRYSITFETTAAVSSTALLEVDVAHEGGFENLQGASLESAHQNMRTRVKSTSRSMDQRISGTVI